MSDLNADATAHPRLGFHLGDTASTHATHASAHSNGKSKRRANRRFSCALITVVATSTMTVFAGTYTAHAFSQKAICVNGNIMSNPDGFVSGGTMYLPIWYVMQALKRIGFANTWNGTDWHITTPTSFQGTLSTTQFGTGKQSITLNQTMTAHVSGIVATDPQSGHATMFMPIWYVMQLIEKSGYNVQWNGDTWNMTPAGNVSSTPPVTPPQSHPGPYFFLMYMSGSDASIADVNMYTPNVTELSASGLYLNADGSVGGAPATNALNYGQSKSIANVPRLFSANSSVMTTVLSNPALRTAFTRNVANLIQQDGLSGINLDFEIVPVSQRNNFTALLREMYAKLHPLGKELSVALPAVTNPAVEYWDNGYDYSGIGQNVDYAVIMAYDYSYPDGSPGPIAPVWWANKAAQYAISQIPNGKVVLGMDTYAYDWGRGSAEAHGLPYVDTQIQSSPITVQWDAADQAPFYTYVQSGVKHTVFYENAQSIAAKILVAQQLHLAGIAVWRAGLEDASVASVLSAYQG